MYNLWLYGIILITDRKRRDEFTFNLPQSSSEKKEALFMLFIKAYAQSPTGGASGKTVKKPTTTGTTKTNMPSVKK